METLTASPSMSGITVATTTLTDESEHRCLAPEKRSCLEPSQQTQSLDGASSLMTQDSKESTAPFLETREHIKVRNSYDRRIRLLIASGLIAGITPTSVRKRSGQATLDIAFSRQDGGSAEEPKADS